MTRRWLQKLLELYLCLYLLVFPPVPICCRGKLTWFLQHGHQFSPTLSPQGHRDRPSLAVGSGAAGGKEQAGESYNWLLLLPTAMP